MNKNGTSSYIEVISCDAEKISDFLIFADMMKIVGGNRRENCHLLLKFLHQDHLYLPSNLESAYNSKPWDLYNTRFLYPAAFYNVQIHWSQSQQMFHLVYV